MACVSEVPLDTRGNPVKLSESESLRRDECLVLGCEPLSAVLGRQSCRRGLSGRNKNCSPTPNLRCRELLTISQLNILSPVNCTSLHLTEFEGGTRDLSD